MNKRIRELGEKVADHPDMFGLYHFSMKELERFAELIVRECADLCLKYAECEGPFNTMEFRKGQHFNTIIKEHFGVEE